MNNYNKDFESTDLWAERLAQKNKRRTKFEKKNRQKNSKLFKLDELDFNRKKNNGTY